MAVNAENKVLLVRKTNKKIWQFPAGSLSVNEDVTGALRRELKEELGLDAESFAAEGIIGVRHRRNTKYGNNVFIIFLLRCSAAKHDIRIVDKEEIAEARFFSRIEATHNDRVDWIVKEVLKKHGGKKEAALSEMKNTPKPDDSVFYTLFL